MTAKSIANISLVLGQSNAMNFNTHSTGYPGGWTAAALNGGYAETIWNVGHAAWEQYVPGTNSDPYAPTSDCWGPEASIGLAKRALVPQRATYFFKYCMGGTGLAKTTNFNWNPYSDSMAFTQFCDELQKALTNLAAFRLPVIDECFWIGQESDTSVQADADAGMVDLPMLAHAIRSRFDAYDMKFVIARMKDGIGVDGLGGSKTAAVRASQEATGSLPRNAYVNTDNLTATGGHYIVSDVVTLGTRLFTASQGIII